MRWRCMSDSREAIEKWQLPMTTMAMCIEQWQGEGNESSNSYQRAEDLGSEETGSRLT